jgi:peptide/nickel transport system permease protein
MQGGDLSTPLGTDFHSRDILSRIIYGARVSLIVGLIGTLVAGAIGTLLGIIAGYAGGWIDQVIMRITDAWMALPTLIFAIFLASVLKPSLWNIVVILSLVFWSQYARIIRGQVLSLRERPFVQLAQVTGASSLRIIRRHILPNVINTVMVLLSLTIGVAIIIEASLSFLGVGVPPPKPAWGLMMAEGRGPLIAGKWWVSVFPGLCIMLLVLATNLLGDWMRVHFDPQLRNR